MNIFILDEAQHLCARYHSDVHLNSQLKEAVQILSTVYGGPYKPTHTQHPCVRWAAESHAKGPQPRRTQTSGSISTFRRTTEPAFLPSIGV